MKHLAIILLLLIPIIGHAGDLVSGATVIEVANTYSGNDDFTVRVSGGSGVCATVPYITFPASASPSIESHQRAFSIALMALTTGNPVRIHNFINDQCSGAAFILVQKN